MAVVSRIGAIALDCEDPVALGEFYAKLAGWEVGFTSERFVAVKAGGLWLTLHRVADYRAPTWPEGDVPKQIHLDLAAESDDLDAAEAEALTLGATKASEQPNPTSWRVLLDPAGHPFCLSLASAFPPL